MIEMALLEKSKHTLNKVRWDADVSPEPGFQSTFPMWQVLRHVRESSKSALPPVLQIRAAPHLRTDLLIFRQLKRERKN